MGRKDNKYGYDFQNMHKKHGYSTEYHISARIGKHYCPYCRTLLQIKRKKHIIKPDKESIANLYFYGGKIRDDTEVNWDVFYCSNCDIEISTDVILSYERKQKETGGYVNFDAFYTDKYSNTNINKKSDFPNLFLVGAAIILIFFVIAILTSCSESNGHTEIEDENVPGIIQPIETSHSEEGSDHINMSDMPQIGYGYVNYDGDKIIVLLAEMDDMDNNRLLNYFTYAIGENGKSYRIEYNDYQERGEKNNNRDNMYNFDNQAGCVYNIIDSPAVPNDTYILLSNVCN